MMLLEYSSFWTKASKVIVALALWLIAYFSPAIAKIAVIVTLVTMDMCTGIWKTVKISGWSGIKSRRLFDTITKIILYGSSILISYAIEIEITEGQIPLLSLITWGITGIEFKSMMENISAIIGKDVLKAIKEKYLDNLKSNSDK